MQWYLYWVYNFFIEWICRSFITKNGFQICDLLVNFPNIMKISPNLCFLKIAIHLIQIWKKINTDLLSTEFHVSFGKLLANGWKILNQVLFIAFPCLFHIFNKSINNLIFLSLGFLWHVQRVLKKNLHNFTRSWKLEKSLYILANLHHYINIRLFFSDRWNSTQINISPPMIFSNLLSASDKIATLWLLADIRQTFQPITVLDGYIWNCLTSFKNLFYFLCLWYTDCSTLILIFWI